MCKEIYHTTPDDPRIENMDPVQKIWMYENWLADHADDAELAKNHAYLVGSFWNPEAVKQLVNGDTHQSTDEDFEESSNMVREFTLKQLQNKEKQNTGRKRRKRSLQKD